MPFLPKFLFFFNAFITYFFIENFPTFKIDKLFVYCPLTYFFEFLSQKIFFSIKFFFYFNFLGNLLNMSKKQSFFNNEYIALTCFSKNKVSDENEADDNKITVDEEVDKSTGGNDGNSAVKGLNEKRIDLLMKKNLAEFGKFLSRNDSEKQHKCGPMCVPSINNWISYLTAALAIITLGVAALVIIYSVYFFTSDKLGSLEAKFEAKTEALSTKTEALSKSIDSIKEGMVNISKMINTMSASLKESIGRRGKD
ncbi:unnamed protein product [Meloidogyne enterolobii]|uniref:Uncharacterized protein n=1 Tax=Meloidogyne enterolobii TaxID=390850 RepID=A0ACB1AS41_MELEN